MKCRVPGCGNKATHTAIIGALDEQAGRDLGLPFPPQREPICEDHALRMSDLAPYLQRSVFKDAEAAL